MGESYCLISSQSWRDTASQSMLPSTRKPQAPTRLERRIRGTAVKIETGHLVRLCSIAEAAKRLLASITAAIYFVSLEGCTRRLFETGMCAKLSIISSFEGVARGQSLPESGLVNGVAPIAPFPHSITIFQNSSKSASKDEIHVDIRT